MMSMDILSADALPKKNRFRPQNFNPAARKLFVFVSIFSKLLLAFVGRNFPQLAFSSAGHTKLLRLAAIT